LRIVVCTKETPDTAAQFEVDADGSVTWGDAPLGINPWDEYAVEEALRLKERGAGACTALALGGEATLDALKHALAMGVDDAVLIRDEVFRDADTLVTSRALSRAIQKFDDVRLALFGKLTTDGASGQTAVQVGRRLGWNTLTYVSKIVEIDFDAGTITVERLLEDGRQVVESTPPAVVSVLKEINVPRYTSFMGIRKAARAEIPTWSAADIGVDGSVAPKVVWRAVSALPPREGACEMIEAKSPQEAAIKLVDRLIAEKVV
jgi:electron transfer flavoprotein beta subunit